MPLSRIQIDVLRLLASHRDPESYVAGSTPLNRDAPRYSGDIDIFHDREELVARTAESDAAVLQQQHGYTLQWQRREPTIYTVVVERSGEVTKLEWVVDSDFRFFPTMRDETFGYELHPVDLATNKAAAYGRREPRDTVDLLTIHERILPLGAAIWGSAGKALGFTPEGIINEIRRVARYTEADFRRVASDPPVDPVAVMTRLREILNEAEAFVSRMPTDKADLLFVKEGHAVQPDPTRLQDYQTHAGQRRGHWPTSA